MTLDTPSATSSRLGEYIMPWIPPSLVCSPLAAMDDSKKPSSARTNEVLMAEGICLSWLQVNGQ